MTMLEGLELAPFVSALTALAGVLVGLGVAHFVLPDAKKVKRLEAEIERLRREHEEYRGRVNGHFHKTAELISTMTASYKAVYDHLSEGAQELCAGGALSGPALFSAPRLILAENLDVSPEGVRPGASPVGIQEKGPQEGGSATAASSAARTNENRAETAGADEGASDTATVSGAGDDSGDEAQPAGDDVRF